MPGLICLGATFSILLLRAALRQGWLERPSYRGPCDLFDEGDLGPVDWEGLAEERRAAPAAREAASLSRGLASIS